MEFPFVSRSHHEEEVHRLKEQIVALCRLLYPEGVPEEFQLLCGVWIPKPEPKDEAEPVKEPVKEAVANESVDDAWEEEQASERARLASLRRTSPSRVGPTLEKMMAKKMLGGVRAAHPSAKFFAQARAEVETAKP